jgi:hypothetical protein
MEATLERIERESAALPPDAQAELVASLVKGMGEGARSLLTSLLGAALAPILKPILEAGPGVYAYLGRLQRDAVITEATFMKAGMAWSSIVLTTRKPLPPADVAPGDDGSVLISWDRDEHHLEIEVFPGDGPNELFYGNRATDETWSCDLDRANSLPRAAQAKIKLLADRRR